MASQDWWFGDPRPLLYTSETLYSRVQWFLGNMIWYDDCISYSYIKYETCLHSKSIARNIRCSRLETYSSTGGVSYEDGVCVRKVIEKTAVIEQHLGQGGVYCTRIIAYLKPFVHFSPFSTKMTLQKHDLLLVKDSYMQRDIWLIMQAYRTTAAMSQLGRAFKLPMGRACGVFCVSPKPCMHVNIPRFTKM